MSTEQSLERSRPSEIDNQPEVTYWVDRTQWGKGIASAALQILLAETAGTSTVRPERPRTTSVRFEYWRKLGSDALASTATSAPGRGEEIEERSCASTEVGTELCVSSQGGVPSRPPVSLRDAAHAGGTGELHAGGPPGCLPRKLNILGTAPYPRRVTAPSRRSRRRRSSPLAGAPRARRRPHRTRTWRPDP